jgi:hypothetical protein
VLCVVNFRLWGCWSPRMAQQQLWSCGNCASLHDNSRGLGQCQWTSRLLRISANALIALLAGCKTWQAGKHAGKKGGMACAADTHSH